MTAETVENGERFPDANQEALAFRELKYRGFRVRHRIKPPVVVTYSFWSPWGDYECRITGVSCAEKTFPKTEILFPGEAR